MMVTYPLQDSVVSGSYFHFPQCPCRKMGRRGGVLPIANLRVNPLSEVVGVKTALAAVVSAHGVVDLPLVGAGTRVVVHVLLEVQGSASDLSIDALLRVRGTGQLGNGMSLPLTWEKDKRNHRAKKELRCFAWEQIKGHIPG